MFFVASKLLSFFCQPLAWLFIAIASLFLSAIRHQQLKTACILGVITLLFCLTGWKYAAQEVIAPLENQYPSIAGQVDLSQFEGVVVLGGALEDGEFWTRPHQPALNSAAERMTTAISLLRLRPQLKILFTGGEGRLVSTGPQEAERAQQFFEEMGILKDQLILESASRNTIENAAFSAALPGVDIHRPWLLVTSAFHMPRAMQVFKKTGWNVTAYPVDYRAPEHPRPYSFDFADGAELWRLALHEYLGLGFYALSGKL